MSLETSRHGLAMRALHADQSFVASTSTIATLLFALSVAILSLGAGTARGHEESCSPGSATPPCSGADAGLGQFYNKFKIAPRYALVLQVRFVVVTFELRFPVKEEFIFHVAEHRYRRKLYPKAADFYRYLLASTNGRYCQQALLRLYEIANYWLHDSWEAIKRGGDFNRPTWLDHIYSCNCLSDILPDPRDLFQKVLLGCNLLHWDESKPFFNEEGRAIELLRCVHDRDPAGPFADKALFLMGYVAWFHEDWRRADECFSRLEKKHPASAYFPHALELAIKAKLMRDDTAEDRQQLAEARRLIYKAVKHPRLSEEQKNSVMRCLQCVIIHQADLDFQDAEKCPKADRLDEAISRFQKICEDYPATYDADRAKERLKSLKRK